MVHCQQHDVLVVAQPQHTAPDERPWDKSNGRCASAVTKRRTSLSRRSPAATCRSTTGSLIVRSGDHLRGPSLHFFQR